MKTIPPRVPGVYQILCIPTSKIYIGSAVDMHDRWDRHRRDLRQGNHRNRHLQSAWEKYGEENFEFCVLEFVATSELLNAEQMWIDRTGCAYRDIGFNIYDVAGSPGDAHAQVWEGFVDPNGDEVTIINLYDFCRQNNLDFPSMHRLASGNGKLKSYKGWTHRNSPRQREYVKTYEGFIDPDGNSVDPITNLAAFCREHRLDNTHMVAVAHGRIYSHRGWTYSNDRQKLGLPKTYPGFINPGGERVVITNLQAYCRENGLDVIHMREVIAGRRKSHKGWTWKDDDE